MKGVKYFVSSIAFIWLVIAMASLQNATAQSTEVRSGVDFAKADTIPSPVLYPYSIAAADLSSGGATAMGVVGVESPGLCSAVGVPLNPSPTSHPWNCSGFAGDAPVQLIFADVNLDGNIDAVATDGDLPLITVGLGNGVGDFPPDAGLYAQCGYATKAVAVGDLNGDGIPDIVATVLGVAHNPGCLAIFFGEGEGKFSKAQEISSGGNIPSSVAIGDVNGDGILDLVVANFGTEVDGDYGNVSVLLGNGDGSFQKPVRYIGLHDPMQVILADFNGDGKLDMSALAPGQKVVYFSAGNGDGSFSKPATYKLAYPGWIAAADMNGDGKLDLVACGGTTPDNPGVAEILLGNGDGTFQPQQNFEVGINPLELAVADFNGDGKPDIATLNGGDSTISILLNTTQFPAKKR
jgi:hypothetical protein